jgi:hypothetical protein
MHLCRPAGAWFDSRSNSRDLRPWLNYVAAPRLDFRPRRGSYSGHFLFGKM